MPKVNKDDPWAAAQPPGTKVEAKPGRNYINEAFAVFGQLTPEELRATAKADGSGVLAAIIMAQALDRFSSRLIDAAAISKAR